MSRSRSKAKKQEKKRINDQLKEQGRTAKQYKKWKLRKQNKKKFPSLY